MLSGIYALVMAVPGVVATAGYASCEPPARLIPPGLAPGRNLVDDPAFAEAPWLRTCDNPENVDALRGVSQDAYKRASAASGAEAHQPRILRPGHVRLSRGSPCLAAGLFPRARGLCCRTIRRDAALFVLRGGAGGLPRRRAVDVPRSLRSHGSDVVSPWQPRVQAAFDHGSASIQLDHDDRDSAAHERHAPRR